MGVERASNRGRDGWGAGFGEGVGHGWGLGGVWSKDVRFYVSGKLATLALTTLDWGWSYHPMLESVQPELLWVEW